MKIENLTQYFNIVNSLEEFEPPDNSKTGCGGACQGFCYGTCYSGCTGCTGGANNK